MTSRNASAERPLKPASMSMNFSRCVPWNRDPPIRTKKNNRTSGSFQCPTNVESTAGSVGHRWNGAAKKSRKRVTGNRNAVMKPPKEKRLQKTGSRSTSAGASASAWTVSRPGFQASDSWAEPISSAMSNPPEDQVHDGARDSEPQEHVDSEDDLPWKRLSRELDRLGLPDQHEPGERVPHHEGEEDDVQVEDRRRPQQVQEGRIRGLTGSKLDEHVQEDEAVQGADDAARFPQLEHQVSPVPEPPARAALPGVLSAGHRITATKSRASGAGACVASSPGISGSESPRPDPRPSGRRRSTRPRRCTPRRPPSCSTARGARPLPRPACRGCIGGRGPTPRARRTPDSTRRRDRPRSRACS